MTIISRIGAVLFIFALAIPSSIAHGTKEPKSCTNKEFWSPSNGCCLPTGGPPTPPPPPPKGTTCPPSSHYWGEKQGCCVPRHPPPSEGPPPQCPKGWVWNSAVRRCIVVSTPPSVPPSTPSGHYGGYGQGDGHGQGNGNGHGHGWRRSSQLKSRSAPLCPSGLDACPILGANGGDYECLDPATELESCGGCSSTGKGQDCTAIVGAWNVACDEGRCAVYTCSGGFKRALDGLSCVPI